MSSSPFDYTFHDGIAVINVVGTSTIAHVEQLARDLSVQAGAGGAIRLIVVDRNAAPSLPVAGVRAIVDLLRRHLLPVGLTALAYVAPHDALYGTARMFTTYAEMIGIRAAAFREEEDAMAWLSAD
jgi:hypothetical protein